MKVSKRQLRRIIKEEMTAAAVPLEAIVGALASDVEEEEGRDLGHSKEGGEAKMTRAQLSHIQQDASDLVDMLNDDDELPEWMQSKVAAVADKMQDVHDYIEYKTGEISERVGLKVRLKKFIREQADMLDADSPSDVEAVEGVWGGDPEGKGRNLSLSIDHSKAIKSDPVTASPEMLPAAEPVLNKEGRIQVYRGQNDLGKAHKLPGIVYERYYDAAVSGHTGVAADILEEHLDTRFPGWSDYEWRS